MPLLYGVKYDLTPWTV